MSKHALVLDGDYLAYSAMAAAESEIDWGDDVWSLQCDHSIALTIFRNSIVNIIERRKEWKNSKIILCFTDDVNWRKELLPTYKENRKKTRKPVGYKVFIERLRDDSEGQFFLREGLEGDDCMGIIGTKPSIVGCESATLASCDKDFKTIPDVEFYWMTTGEVLVQTLETADYWHMYQTLIGDTTDGYTGIKGIGQTVAEEFLESPFYYVKESKTFKSGARKGESVEVFRKTTNEAEGTDFTLWEQMVTLAWKHGMTEAELLVQAQVARICRASDYDFKEKKPIFWTP